MCLCWGVSLWVPGLVAARGGVYFRAGTLGGCESLRLESVK